MTLIALIVYYKGIPLELQEREKGKIIYMIILLQLIRNETIMICHLLKYLSV